MMKRAAPFREAASGAVGQFHCCNRQHWDWTEMIVSYRRPVKSADIRCENGELGRRVAVPKQHRLHFIPDWRLGPAGVKCLAISCLDVFHRAGQIERKMDKKLWNCSGRGGDVGCRSRRSIRLLIVSLVLTHALMANTIAAICFVLFFVTGRMSHFNCIS